MDTTNSSRELHLTVANEDYLECMVRIESEEGETNGVRSVDIAQAARLARLSGTVIASSARFWFRSSVSNLSEPIPRPA